MVIGSGFGAWLFAVLLRRHRMPEYPINVSTLALVVYTFANHLHHESGLLAVTVMGMTLAKMRRVPIREVVDFKESLGVMIISVLFIVTAARVDFSQQLTIDWRARRRYAADDGGGAAIDGLHRLVALESEIQREVVERLDRAAWHRRRRCLPCASRSWVTRRRSCWCR